MTNSFRTENDSLGSIEVPREALWGAQTQRSLLNFAIGQDQIPMKLIYSLARIKQAASIVNNRLGTLDDNKRDLIVNAACEIAMGKHDAHFPLSVWQTGSGTQTNMNLNEVISNLASKATGKPLGSHLPLHPNDDVNQSQSTNDVFPAAIQIATVQEIQTTLIPELDLLIESLTKKEQCME